MTFNTSLFELPLLIMMMMIRRHGMGWDDTQVPLFGKVTKLLPSILAYLSEGTVVGLVEGGVVGTRVGLSQQSMGFIQE